MVLAAAMGLNWDIWQLDVQRAILDTHVQEVYIKMAPGCEKTGPATLVPLVCELKRLPYGLNQSPFNWGTTIDDSLGEIGFTPRSSGPCITPWSTIITTGRSAPPRKKYTGISATIGNWNVIATFTLYVDGVFYLEGTRRCSGCVRFS